MIELVRHWLQSVRLLGFKELHSIMSAAWDIFYRAVATLLTRFASFIITDIALFVLFGAPMMALMTGGQEYARGVSMGLWALRVLYDLNWFVITSIAILLLAWQPNDESPLSFVRRSFVRYLYLILVVFVIIALFVIAFLLLSVYSTNVASLNWSIMFIVATVMAVLILLFWLDADGSPQSFVYSCERGLNFLLYNMPAITFFVTMIWVSDYLISTLFFGGNLLLGDSGALVGGQFEQLYSVQQSWLTPVYTVVFKYCRQVVVFFWMSAIVVLYKRYGAITYRSSIFDR